MEISDRKAGKNKKLKGIKKTYNRECIYKKEWKTETIKIV
jgi:hypothetical protein